MSKFLGTRYPYPLNLHATLVLSLISILPSRDFLSPSINLILISESSAVSGLPKQPVGLPSLPLLSALNLTTVTLLYYNLPKFPINRLQQIQNCLVRTVVKAPKSSLISRPTPRLLSLHVFINGKQVKTDKITQIIPRFPRFYVTKSTGNSQRRYSPTNTTGVNTDLCTPPVTPPNKHFTLQPTTHGCGQLADGLKVGRRDISKF